MLCLDGAYAVVDGQPQFQRVPLPTKTELETVLERITTRIGRHLERQSPLAARHSWPAFQKKRRRH